MKAWVDDRKCRGHARCVAIAPDVFLWHDVADHSYVPEGMDLGGHEEEVRLAALNCPEQAIALAEGI